MKHGVRGGGGGGMLAAEEGSGTTERWYCSIGG